MDSLKDQQLMRKSGQVVEANQVLEDKKVIWTRSSHRDRSKHAERACSVEAVDKIKPVLIYCWFNISLIWKTVFENQIIFAFSKMP